MVNGRILGRPGGSVTGASWARNAGVAAAGAAGEVKTGKLLAQVAAAGPDVLHDVRVPGVGFEVNIDHIVVSGSTVYLIDSKMWRPGLYWSLGGKTRRGLESQDRLASRNMHMAWDKITDYLAAAGLPVRVARPIVAVWPSREDRPLRLFVYGTGMRVISAERLARILPRRQAQASITDVLARLLYR